VLPSPPTDKGSWEDIEPRSLGSYPWRGFHVFGRQYRCFSFEMPYFLLTFGDANRPPVAAIILAAPSMFQARMTAVVRRFAPGVPFGEGLEVNAKMMAQSHRNREPAAEICTGR
jgi:hypothetical protein